MKRATLLCLPLLAGCASSQAREGSSGEAPFAVLSEPFRNVLAGSVVVLDGTASYDPDNAAPAFPHGVDGFEWTLAPPADSLAVLAYGTSGFATFTADVTGAYGGELVVVDSDGIASEPAPFGITADPIDPEAEGLFVRMTWNDNGSDMDLHLVREGGEFYVAPGDCHYANANPDWGAPGSDNDPSLEMDSASGPGPEETRVRTPQATTYDVFAHYFSDNGLGSVSAEVVIAHDGVQVAEGAASLVNDQVWRVGTVVYSDSSTAPTFEPIDQIFQNPYGFQ